MPEHVLAGQKKEQKADRIQHISAPDPRQLSQELMAWDISSYLAGDPSFSPSIQMCADLLSEAPSAELRATIARQLQQTYGNQFIQRLVNRVELHDHYERKADREPVEVSNTPLPEVQRNDEKTQLNYYVSGVPTIAQTSDKTCWAAVGAMMIGWQHGGKVTIEEALGTLGENADMYLNQYRQNYDIAYADKGRYLDAIGLFGEEPTNYTPEGLQEQLQAHGPIWVTTRPLSSLHARILTGIEGDGSVDGTMLEIINPEGGVIDYETVREFSEKYEAAKGDLVKVQMAYF